VRTEISRAEIEKRFGSGALSLAACRDGEIIAWQWAEFGAVSLVDFAGETFDFGPHSPHLFDAYTVPAARGMRVLPLVCNAMFHALAARGHERAVTLIRPENAPSRAAAAHLGFRETGALVQRSRGADRRITLRR
jgi:RimJ/RimL family protein N-acetyltransferase